MNRCIRVTTTILLFLIAATSLSHDVAAAPPANFANELVLPAIFQPISLRALPDGRLLILLKGGEILITDPNATPASSATYMTITNLNDQQERGVIDIAIDPNFNANGLFYLYYTPDTPARARISSFFHQENVGGLTSTGDNTSEVVLWEDNEGYTTCCHYGGGLDFGPEGRLWLTFGDKFDGTDAQDPTKAAGSVIRINSDGSIPADNFGMSDGVGGIHDAVFAYGLRNPFRARWDFIDNRMYIGEVGGNAWGSWEDLHVLTLADSATNYGWPNCEGACDNPSYPTCDCNSHQEGLFSYPHFGTNASITGGVVYRGTQFPSQYQGAYFFGDFARGWVHYLTFDGNGDVSAGTPIDGSAFENSAGPVVAFEQGADGALYYLTIFGSSGNQGAGDLRRFVYDDGNQAPVITSAAANPDSGAAPLAVTFTGVTTDAEGDSLTYLWVFGDGDSLSGEVVNDTVPDAVHNYVANGAYQARLFVADPSHTTGSDPIYVSVGAPPTVTIDMPANGSLFEAGDIVGYSATGNDPDGVLDGSNYAWTVRFRHDQHFHPDVTGVSGQSGSFEVPTSGHDFSGNTAYVLDVLVTDDDGLTAADTVEILPDKVDLTFDTSPSGLVVTIDGIPHVTPYVHNTLIGFQHTIAVNTTQCYLDSAYNFDNWSDAGAATHVITAPNTNASYTAVFNIAGSCTLTVQVGLVMRLKGDLGVTDAGGDITLWADQSPSGNDMTPGTNGSPTLLPGELKGRDVVSFDGIDDGLGRTGLAGLPTGAADRSVFMVVKYESNGWAGFTWGEAACNRVFGLAISIGGNLGVQGWCEQNDFEASVFANGNGWMTQAVVLGGNSFTHYQNGNVIDTDTHIFDTGTDRIRLGVEQNDNRHLQVQVAEVLVYDRAVSDMERQQIEAYLQNEYFDAPQATTITITKPQDGETLFGEKISVTWTAAGDLSAAEHVHVKLDSLPRVTIHQFTGTHVFTSVAPGPHRLIVELANSSHTVLATDTADVVLEATCPLVDTGLAVQLESDLGVTTTGSDVDFWLDQTTNQNDLTSGGNPQYITLGGPNGKPFVAFDGNDDRMERVHSTTPIVGLPTGAADRTMFMVARYDGNGFGGFGYGNPACAEAFALAVSPNGKLTIQGWCEANDFESTTFANGAGWLIQSVVLSANTLHHYKNGVLIDAQSHVFGTTIEKMVLGAEIDGSPSIDMDAAAILVYDRALDEAERRQVEAYLQQKYFGATCFLSNVPPDANDDVVVTTIGGTVAIDVLMNDFDPDGSLDLTSVVVVSPPNNGTHSILPNGDLSYTHDSSPAPADSFTYRVADDAGENSNEATVRITIAPPTAIGEGTAPVEFALHQNVPNPFNPTTEIRYDVARGGGRVTLKVYDVSGRLVRTLVDGEQNEGRKRVEWDGRNRNGRQVATGTYFYRLTAPRFTQTRKMILLK